MPKMIHENDLNYKNLELCSQAPSNVQKHNNTDYYYVRLYKYYYVHFTGLNSINH